MVIEMRWNDIIGAAEHDYISYAVLAVEIKIPLYHISLTNVLQGIWKPKDPIGGNDSNNGTFTEKILPRISVGPTIEDCFRAIYPNVSKNFEEEKLPYIDFHVYQPIFNGMERILLPSTLTDFQLVHDAHVTHEHCILDPVYMRHVSIVRINNTNKSPDMNYNPFGDIQNPERFLAPLQVPYQTLYQS
jgi:hypothetical protein